MEKIKKDVNEQENRAIQELENDSTKEKESEVSEKKVRKVKKQEEFTRLREIPVIRYGREIMQ